MSATSAAAATSAPEVIPPAAQSAQGSQALPKVAPGKTVLIDNYDSFTYNVVEFLSELGADLVVYRNDKVTIEEIEALQPANIVISPGPGHPLHDSGISIPCIKHFAGKVPIMGVCMGLQAIYAAYTGIVEFAGEILHGKTSPIVHDARGLYAGLAPDAVVGTRYHSLAAHLDSLPRELVVTSKTDQGVVMGIRHTRLAVEAIQYHPESILSKGGKEMFANFLSWTGGTWKENPQAGIDDAAVEQAESTKEPVIAMAAAGGAGAAAAAAAGATAVASSSKPNGISKGSIGTILERIHLQRLQDVAEAKAVPGFSPRDLETGLAMHLSPPLINFPARLTANAAHGLPGVMAEMKRASPSKGDIDPDAHAGAQALAYARGGASVISVLTEPKWFKGSLNDLTLARKAVDGMPNRPAILRKDFIIDTYQIMEARLAGADTVLLIVAMLTDPQLKVLYDFSVSLGMEPLVEVNNPEEMTRALKLGAKVVGVNNRNLHDFNVDMGTTSRLADAAKEAGVILAALSGITGRSDVEKYLQEGVGAVLVGEALMRSTDKKAFIQGLLGLPTPAANGVTSTTVSANGSAAAEGHETPLVKICGIKTVDAAISATMAGADMLGMILAPGTKRTVTLSQAAEIVNVVRSFKGGAESIRAASAALTMQQIQQQSEHPQLASPSTPLVQGQDWFQSHAQRIRTNPHAPLIVGVFRNQPLSEVQTYARALRLDVVQLHGRTEDVEWSKFLPGVLVIRVFHVGKETREGPQDDLREATRPGYHHIAALDTAGSKTNAGQEGGSGEAFDWNIVERVANLDPVPSRVKGAEVQRQPIMLAGGLTPDNVVQAIEAAKPFIVDVSSGVELADGQKDVAKIQAFVKAAKSVSVPSRGRTGTVTQ
ncbi:IGPS-domain-containing protein [Acaromyces ingoldii]|uniref:Multifunctional tryptophan biosynthesis protein n=1 Tax=Acaromyces ingoldii TaxID=215250 RepID=A0A316YL90_9BASI|nr:IGPS-domain-containing protein [Acaromyces ingoldii]PWN90157.1 IGPS-domain-containing protein [Acaromyces ingoldii]